MSKVRDPKIAKEFRGKPCIVCHSTRDTVGHHLLTVGARPDLANNKNNIVSVCVEHHAGFHRMGLTEATRIYCLTPIMIFRGFEFSDYNKKWFFKKPS